MQFYKTFIIILDYFFINRNIFFYLNYLNANYVNCNFEIKKNKRKADGIALQNIKTIISVKISKEPPSLLGGSLLISRIFTKRK